MSLLRSEWLKLFSTRTLWVMIGIGLLCEALFAGLFVGLASLAEFESAEDIEGIFRGTWLLMMMMLVLGVLAITTEFRHGTTGSTFLASPKRYPVMAAKLAAALLLGLLAGLAFVLVNGGLALPLFSERGVDLPSSGDLAAIYAGVAASFALLCAFGLGIGAIVRNQVGAIIAAIACFFILPWLPELLPGDLGQYFPTQALGALHRLDEEGDLSQVGGGLVLAAWVAGLNAIGTVLICRRDVAD
jgi:hypothetical protein